MYSARNFIFSAKIAFSGRYALAKSVQLFMARYLHLKFVNSP
jgi:hypothetical protein